jgi:predicted RNA binding protein YcfA (HicA-like mRNA interferase family)
MIAAIKPTNYQTQIKIFQAAGCIYVRTQGDHMVYHHPDAVRPVVIPKYREVPVFIIRNNMKTIGMTPDEYITILGEL